jgi:hypothetical protein
MKEVGGGLVGASAASPSLDIVYQVRNKEFKYGRI